MQPAPTKTRHDAALNNTVCNGILLDLVIQMLNLKNDAALCRKLAMRPSTISRIRHGHKCVNATMLIRMHELTDLAIGDMKRIARGVH